MLHATIARAVVQMESMKVVIESGDRIGVDYPAEIKPAQRIPEPKAIHRALRLLKTALHQYAACPDAVESEEVYNLQVGENRILLYKKD